MLKEFFSPSQTYTKQVFMEVRDTYKENVPGKHTIYHQKKTRRRRSEEAEEGRGRKEKGEGWGRKSRSKPKQAGGEAEAAEAADRASCFCK